MNSNTIYQAYKEAHLQRTEDIDPVDDYDDYKKRVRQEYKFSSEIVKRLIERDAQRRRIFDLTVDNNQLHGFRKAWECVARALKQTGELNDDTTY